MDTQTTYGHRSGDASLQPFRPGIFSVVACMARNYMFLVSFLTAFAVWQLVDRLQCQNNSEPFLLFSFHCREVFFCFVSSPLPGSCIRPRFDEPFHEILIFCASQNKRKFLLAQSDDSLLATLFVLQCLWLLCNRKSLRLFILWGANIKVCAPTKACKSLLVRQAASSYSKLSVTQQLIEWNV